MGELDSLRRLAIAGVVLSVVIGVPSTLAFFAAFDWSFEAALFGDPAAILGHGPERAALLRWGAVGDMLYSYLLLVPLALFLHRRLRPNRPWLADVGTLAGLAYIFVGGAGAAILAIAGSSLVEAYSAAAPAEQPQIAVAFEMVRNIVFFALWQMLDALTLGIWVASVGVLLLSEKPVVGRLLAVLGVGAMAASLMSMSGVHSLTLFLAGVAVVLVVWIGWVVLDRVRAPRAAVGPSR